MGGRCIANECLSSTGFSYTLSLINGKYKMTILYTLMEFGVVRFNEMKKYIGGISYKTLSATLKELEADQLVHREVSTPFKNVIFRRNGMSFFAGQHTGVYSLNHRFTCRPEARQVLIYQCILDLTGENDKYNYSKAAHLYPPFSYIPCSAKNYKIAPALTRGVPPDPTQGGIQLDRPGQIPHPHPGRDV